MKDFKEPEPEFQAFLDRMSHEGAMYLRDYTVPFFDEMEGDQLQGGTGVLLQIGPWHFILSAAHVLDLYSVENSPLYVMGSEEGATLIPLHGAELYTSYMPDGGARHVDDA